MKIKSNVIKQLRKERLWSQEQLASASGLGLRTIQRLEKSGNASYESIRAIAAVFEVEAQSLFYKDAEFTGYKHRQVGYTILIVFFLIVSFLFTIVGLAIDSVNLDDDILLIAIGISALPVVVATILFSTMTIDVSQDSIIWHFSFGFWKKTLALSEIESATCVKNSVLNGFGIRMLGSGWLYNVSGLHAVHIELKSGSCIRLGSDQPKYLLSAIEHAIDQKE
ncbi:helix-turn-helix transcriptional regulator [Glaciecola sp. SC05]|uniref:helix-turn-helix transcriptional regulator n=1 Tax=Glaciecola sp. SC05 TaxID=1987355 RepID=UPI00352731FF